MIELTPQMALLFASTTAVGMLMMVAGVEKKLLEWRRRRRFCAGCGRELHTPTCSCSR